LVLSRRNTLPACVCAPTAAATDCWWRECRRRDRGPKRGSIGAQSIARPPKPAVAYTRFSTLRRWKCWASAMNPELVVKKRSSRPAQSRRRPGFVPPSSPHCERARTTRGLLIGRPLSRRVGGVRGTAVVAVEKFLRRSSLAKIPGYSARSGVDVSIHLTQTLAPIPSPAAATPDRSTACPARPLPGLFLLSRGLPAPPRPPPVWLSTVRSWEPHSPRGHSSCVPCTSLP